jgi:hypothetical protein
MTKLVQKTPPASSTWRRVKQRAGETTKRHRDRLIAAGCFPLDASTRQCKVIRLQHEIAEWQRVVIAAHRPAA